MKTLSGVILACRRPVVRAHPRWRWAAIVSILLLASTLGSGCADDTREEGPTIPSVTIDDLLSAPVPSLCEHEPGNLVNGRLPLLSPKQGSVEVAKVPEGDDFFVTYGDLTSDGGGDGAFVTSCVAGSSCEPEMWDVCGEGAVAWPQTVQAYTSGEARAVRLGGVDLGDLTHGRELVKSLDIEDGVLKVTWMTNGPNDFACCPSREMTATLRWDGEQMVVENMERSR